MPAPLPTYLPASNVARATSALAAVLSFVALLVHIKNLREKSERESGSTIVFGVALSAAQCPVYSHFQTL